ncbi:MAG TPA: carbon-nitrogen hydrolase, partial [Nevskiales bacterium]|nr:carbon-nitrogen hydrolase [Nevskiales bacterium]
MSGKLKVGLVQMSCTTDREANLAKCERGAREAAHQGAQLVLLQELHNSLYFCQHEDPALFDLAEPIPGPSTERLGRLAKELGVVLERDGSIAGQYRKMHIPDDPGYYEKFYFTPGDLGFQPVKTSIGKLGVLVCWDQWYPEGARLMALAGADLLLYPTAIGWNPQDDRDEQLRQQEAWLTIQRAHAVANGLPVVVANRVGHEPDPTGASPGQIFWGSSFAAGPQGELLARAGGDETV